MSIMVARDRRAKMKHVVKVRHHPFAVDESAANGGENAGPTPHDLYDAALGACKALTVPWYAQRKAIPVEEIMVTVDRDAAHERKGVYRLHATLALTGTLADLQRQELLAVAAKCPLHKLMTEVTTEIRTDLMPASPTP